MCSLGLAWLVQLVCALELTAPVVVQDLKSAVKQALSLLPPHALVGLIAFGQHVYVHELGHEAMPKAVLLRGTAELDGPRVSSGPVL